MLCVVLLLSACVKQQYLAEPIQPEQSLQQILDTGTDNKGFKTFLQLNNYPVHHWPITQWDFHGLALAAIYFNPAIKLARSELTIQQAKQQTAKQRPNPTIGIPLEHHSATGDSPWLIGLVSDFLFERSEKVGAKLKQAEANKRAAKINIEQEIWHIYHELHHKLIEYYATLEQKNYLLAQQDLLKQNLALLERRQELGQVSQFEVSSVRLELQHIQLRIADQDYAINDAYHKLIAITGLQSNKFKKDDIVFTDLDEHLAATITDASEVRAITLNKRFDIRIKLQEYDALEAALKLEIEKQYPDLNLSPGFIFDQGDRIWALGANWVLPLFHNNEGQIQEALARRSHLQAEFIAMQTDLVNRLDRVVQNLQDKQASYKKTLELVEELKVRAGQIKKQFDLGYSDSLSVVRSKLEIEKANQALFAIKVGVLRVFVKLEQIMQQPYEHELDITTLASRLEQLEQK